MPVTLFKKGCDEKLSCLKVSSKCYGNFSKKNYMLNLHPE